MILPENKNRTIFDSCTKIFYFGHMQIRKLLSYIVLFLFSCALRMKLIIKTTGQNKFPPGIMVNGQSYIKALFYTN